MRTSAYRSAENGRRHSAVLILLAWLAAPGIAAAEPTPDAGPAVQWIRPDEVPAWADELLRRLEAARPGATAESSLEEIERSLARIVQDLDVVLGRATEAVERSAMPAELESIGRELAGAAAPLARWKDELEAEAKRVADVLDSIAAGVRIWTETRARPETSAAGEIVARRVESSLAALDQAAASLRPWRERVLDASDKIIDRVAAVDAAREKLHVATARERASLFVPDRAPLWSQGLGDTIRSELPRAPGEIRAYAGATAAYIGREPRPLVVQALVALLSIFVLGRFCSRALRRLAGEEAASRAARLLERPYAIALLLTLLATPVFHPLAPRRFFQLTAMIALFPAARIVVHVSEGASVTAFAGLFLVLFLDRGRSALEALPGIERAIFLLTMAVGFGLIYWIARRVGVQVASWTRRAMTFAMVTLGLAFAAEIGGWTNLAALLGRGAMASAIAAVYVYAAAIAVAALLAYALASHTVRRSHLLARNTAVLQRRAERALRWFGVALWFYFVATAIGFRTDTADALARVLEAGISVGKLSLSIGGVLAFVLTLTAALVLARVVTAVLEEDVYPRTRLPRGVPYVLSTLLRYGFYSFGFLFALAAAGVELGQVAIMLGGLGLGIGLGLQDLVKNFAAGLTLLLERRMHVGDVLEMPSQGIFGRVLSIGTRASVVRTWSGAEVVVPNSDLVSSAITNWTLSDRLCRVEVPVGVAYGTDPERVIALLLGAAGSLDRFLADPPPQVLFRGFGESSLDFLVRGWSDEGYEQMMSLTSDLTLAVHRTLAEAGITIPFPQRDLHLATVSPSARAALSGSGKGGEGER